MSWDIVFKIVALALLSVGSAGAIIFFLSSWLGKIWANRILEQDKAKYNREIEGLKNEFNRELEYYKGQIELSKQALSRYSKHQFNLYRELWTSLSELKISADTLWNKVDIDSVVDFIAKIRMARKDLYKNALLIEEIHEKELEELLNKFSNYSIGKFSLIEFDKQRSSLDFQGALQQALQRRSITEDNKITKDAYDKLLISIKTSFRKQLRKGLNVVPD